MVGLTIEIIILSVLVLILINLFMDEKRLRLARLQAGRVTGSWDGIEKRSSVRINTILSIRYSINHEKKKSSTKNISNGGILMQLNEKLNETTPLALDIALPDEHRPVAARGEVVWIRELSHMDETGRRIFDAGIKFIWMNPKDRERLDRHIRGLM